MRIEPTPFPNSIKLEPYPTLIKTHSLCAKLCVMEQTLRKHIVLPKSTYDFLIEYQNREGLSNFSSTIEAAVEALKRQNRIASYEKFAADYAASEEMQREAETWLNMPMEETPIQEVSSQKKPNQTKLAEEK